MNPNSLATFIWSVGIVLNGSPFFTGGAGSGESEILRKNHAAREKLKGNLNV